LEILEVRTINDGYDPFPVFMGKHRCPKNRNDIEENFPRVFMEITDDEVKEYFSPVDFGIGKTIVIYGRRFLIYDVDNFTKGFYWKNFGLTDFTPINVDIESPDPPKAVSSLFRILLLCL
jgi:EF-hand domain-containing protein 1